MAVAWCIALSAATTHAVVAQTPAGALDTSGRVLLRVYAVVHDDTHYAHPQLGAALRIVGPNGTTIPLKTDAAGTATAWLAPGQYHIATVSPVNWDGRSYAWDQAVDVAPGMTLVELNERNASAVAGSVLVEAPVRRTITADVSRKDPALATVFSFLVPGIGEFYAGAPGTGTFHLVTDLAATGVAVYGISCSADLACTDGEALAIGGATLMLTNTLFSMWDAHHAATNYNKAHGLIGQLELARPLIATGPRGEARIGLSLATR